MSEEMKAWSAALGAELVQWPQCTSRSFFGFSAHYREENIFALLPRTRALDPPDAIAFKLDAAHPRIVSRAKLDACVGFTEMQKKHWFTFAISSDVDLRDALNWLAEAYEAAG